MNLVCIICSDAITAGSETYTTHCGHLFHFACLVQWIERSKTCPQCRNKATEKTIHRVYLNQSGSDAGGDDAATLQNKCDNYQFQLMLKEKDVKKYSEKYNKVKQTNIALREEVAGLESKARVHDSIVHALKDQISFFKSKSKERDKFVEEITRLKNKLKQMESIELAMNGSREEVTEMLKNENDVNSLIILVATLKKALLDAERKKLNMEHKFKQLQTDITRHKREITLLELSNQDLRKELELAKAYSAPKIPQNERLLELKKGNKSPVTPVRGSLSGTDSPSTEEKVTTILQSNSPYLCVKKSCTNLDLPKKINKAQVFADASQMSIFKKPMTGVNKTESSKCNDVVYNGLGGQSKEDLYPSPVTSKIGSKRPKSYSYAPSSKFRKTELVLAFKK